MPNRILVVDDDPISLRLTVSTLSRFGYEVYSATDGLQGLEMVKRAKPDLVILDVMMPVMDGYEVCRNLRKDPNNASLPVIMLTGNNALDEKVNGFEAGADEYLTKPFMPTELQARIKSLLRRSSNELETQKNRHTEGKIIAVYSMRGGMGVTSLAVNLSVALAQLWSDSVILMDLCLVMGQDALMLNLQMRHTWANLVNIPVDEIDFSLVEKLLLQHSSGVRVMASPYHPEQGEALNVDTVACVLKLFKEHYNYIVIDLPHDLRDTTLVGLDNADEIIVLLAPEMASVRATTETLALFNQLNYPREKIHLALNWTFPKLGLARKTIEKVLPQPIELVIPYATEELIRAINWGNPVLLEQPDNPLSALLEDYAFELSQAQHKTKRPPVLNDALQRVVKRKQQRQPASH